MTLDPPRTLPVSSLSLSSIQTFLRCPEKWRRRYIEGEADFLGGPGVLGGAVGAAEVLNYGQKIDSGEDLPEAELLDAYADEFDYRCDCEPVEWGDDKPARLKDQGAKVLPVYHRLIAPTVTPKAVERGFVLEFEDVDWTFTGYIDVEQADDSLIDLKVKGRAISQADADADLQPTSYLLAKRAEGEPAPGFRFHQLVRVQHPEPKHVQPVATQRSDAQLDAFVELVYRVAAEIDWRLANDCWSGAAPGAWWCGERWCGFWRDCEFGGKHRTALPQAVPA